MWHITGQKYVANALGLQRILNLGSYHTAWQWLHKLRCAMVRPGRDRLNGTVEVDETYIGGRKTGKRGRGAAGKVLVGVAVEDKKDKGIAIACATLRMPPVTVCCHSFKELPNQVALSILMIGLGTQI